jgi:regulator of chromosome condensation
LPFEEDDLREVKRAKKIDLFDSSKSEEERLEALDGQGKLDRAKLPVSLRPPVQISKLMCGGMHTVALSPAGIAYSWGCNDEGALGRSGLEQDILPVDLPVAIDGIAVGDSHTIFYNTEKSVAYLTGLYRVSLLPNLTSWRLMISSLAFIPPI